MQRHANVKNVAKNQFVSLIRLLEEVPDPRVQCTVDHDLSLKRLLELCRHGPTSAEGSLPATRCHIFQPKPPRTHETLESMEPTATDRDRETAYLVYEFERRAYALSDAGFTIGRDAASDIVVREPSVSRSHAEVRAEGGEYVLHTSGATGTRLNGHTVNTPQRLGDGDRIHIGTAELTFRRSKLPLGVSVVDPAVDHPMDDVLSRRPTITNPILGVGHDVNDQRKRWPTVLVLLVLAVIAVYIYITQMR